jgi:Domain of unknown function (DUF4304)
VLGCPQDTRDHLSRHRERNRHAQQRFATFLKERISPALRARGFRGSGQAYTLPDDDQFLLVGFQKSVHNDAHEVSFTINLQAVPRVAWDEARAERSWLPDEPAPNTRYGRFAWFQRAGLAMPGQRDVWWTVRADTDLDRLATEILGAFDASLIPALKARRDDAGGAAR